MWEGVCVNTSNLEYVNALLKEINALFKTIKNNTRTFHWNKTSSTSIFLAAFEFHPMAFFFLFFFALPGLSHFIDIFISIEVLLRQPVSWMGTSGRTSARRRGRTWPFTCFQAGFHRLCNKKPTIYLLQNRL